MSTLLEMCPCGLLQALTYFCIYVVRQGVTSWFVFYLMKVGACPGFCPSFTLCGLHVSAAS